MASSFLTRGAVWALALAGMIASAGCGYTTKSTLDEKYQSIYVAAFKNVSKQYDLQAPLTNAVTRKFITDGRLQVVSAGEADLL
ncbi:MAG TPA: LPS assembly lipoprotein LptE, partial [Candidatus Hydrogenedentes bacterium]|nr:LPS assembly lipoprotein LptE [Candidatus Hydrogenedentota bacterium]